jgi:putative nucleotidyltransferase with HDIG domain
MPSVKNQEAIRKTLETISTIPTLSIVIDKLARLLQNPQTSAEEIGRAITMDQALASKVLKLVNSAFYGFPGKIGTITHAVVILGFSTVKNIVLTASIFDAFSNRKNSRSEFSMENFWMHSIACGAASQTIAKHIGFKEKEECFIAGLIHDIGKIILCHYFPEEFEHVFQTARQNGLLFYDTEKQTLGINHEEIGGIITQRWNLPKNLQKAVQNHHAPSATQEFYTLSGIVHAADILVRALDIGNGGDDKIPLMSEAVWKDLGLENLALQSVFGDVEDEYDKATIFMQLV